MRMWARVMDFIHGRVQREENAHLIGQSTEVAAVKERRRGERRLVAEVRS